MLVDALSPELVLGTVGGLVAMTGAYSAVLAPRDLRITTVDVPIHGLSSSLDGYSIAILTDFHHRPGSSLTTVERAVDAAHAARPDTICLLGDFGVSFESSPWLTRRMYAGAMRELSDAISALQAPD